MTFCKKMRRRNQNNAIQPDEKTQKHHQTRTMNPQSLHGIQSTKKMRRLNQNNAIQQAVGVPKNVAKDHSRTIVLSKTPRKKRPRLQCLIQATKNAKNCLKGALVQVTKTIFPPTPISPPTKQMTMRLLFLKHPQGTYCNVVKCLVISCDGL